MAMTLRPETIKRKLKGKPLGTCANGWCQRIPTDGFKTCERCRRISLKWKAKRRLTTRR